MTRSFKMVSGSTIVNLIGAVCVAIAAQVANADGPGAPSNDLPRAAMRTGPTDDESLSAARGHFSRARALLISAVREFDAGAAIYSPEALINSNGWRQGVVARAQELERVIDPQPRDSKRGAKYQADNRLLNKGGSDGQ